MATDMSPITEGQIFDLTEFFTGETRAWGVFEDRFGRVRRRFTVLIRGAWAGDTFVMTEDFVYDDGATEHRVWRLRRASACTFLATTEHCIGAAMVHCADATIIMRYKFNLQLKSKSVVVDFDDRIYRIDRRNAMNRATVSKWGIKIGEVTLFFAKTALGTGQRTAAAA